MALNKANISWSTKQLAKMFDNGRIKTHFISLMPFVNNP